MQNSDDLHLRAELRGHEEDVSIEILLVIKLRFPSVALGKYGDLARR